MSRYNATAYRNETQLEDGRMFSLSFVYGETPGDYHNPPETEQSLTLYFIDGDMITWEELPSELTPDDIDRLERNAKEDSNYDFGGPDY